MTLGKDKVGHFMVCFLITVTGGLALPIGGYEAIGVGAIVAMVWGFDKERRDSEEPGNKFDWYDILADAIGTLVGVLVCVARLNSWF